MKKVLSVMMAALLIACCMPFAALADPATVTLPFNPGEFDFTGSNQLNSYVEYIIPDGVTMTVPLGLTLRIPSSAKLTIEEGGKLNVLGNVLIMEYGELYCKGIIANSSRIALDNSDAVANVQIRFPSLDDPAYMLKDRVKVSASFFVDTEEFKTELPDEGGTYDIPLNAPVRIYAHILEDYEKDISQPIRDKYDDALLAVAINNNQGLVYQTGEKEGTGFFISKATTGGDISYHKWSNDSYFLTTKKIVFPVGKEGYECVPRNPEEANMTEDGVFVVKYGQPFSFKVELDEAYDMSSYEVYLYNSYGWLNLDAASTGEDPIVIAAKPDDYGYYNINEVTGDVTVKVIGVIKNSTINTIGSILETIRSIVNMLKEFFQNLSALFGIAPTP